MNWILIISTIGFVLVVVLLLILDYEHKSLFLQSVCTFIYAHKDWKKYRRLKKYLKTNTIPLINAVDVRNNTGFAFIQYCDIIFVVQGDDVYLSSYYNHLIKDLLKRNQ